MYAVTSLKTFFALVCVFMIFDEPARNTGVAGAVNRDPLFYIHNVTDCYLRTFKRIFRDKVTYKVAGALLIMNGTAELFEVIDPELNSLSILKKCTSEFQNCEFHSKLAVKRACTLINSTSELVHKVLETIKPPLKCPVQPGNYTVSSSVMDWTVVYRPPPEDLYMRMTSKLYQTKKDSKKRMLWCEQFDVIIYGMNSKLNRTETNIHSSFGTY